MIESARHMVLTIEIIWFVGLMVAVIAGLSLSVFQLPGTWVILASGVVYTYFHDFKPFGLVTLVVLLVVALLAEVAEFVAAAHGVKRRGASKAASWGALVGGLLGMILLAPVPMVGPILGGFIGCFAGAFIMERNAHGDIHKGASIGLAAVMGRLVGMIIKTSSAFIMAGICLSLATLYLYRIMAST